jgi:multiple sugar transport system permease protein
MSAVIASRRRRRASPSAFLVDSVLVYVLIAILVLFSLFPFLWMFSTSIKPDKDVFAIPPQWIPNQITFDAYYRALFPATTNGKLFVQYFWNSTIVTVATTILTVVVAVPAAYAFSRFSFPGKDVFFFSVLTRNMFPLVVFLIPLFILMQKLGMQNSYVGLTIAYLTFALPLGIWMLKGFFDGIPVELEKAARIDGCTRLRAFVEVILPLSTPGIIATAIYAFILAWDEYPLANVLMHNTSMRTLPVGLAYFFTENATDWTGLMATSLVISVPVVIVFLVLQNYFVQALSEGAVKY